MFAAPQTLEFRATFGGDEYQHVGFGNTFDETGPWAIVQHGDGGANADLLRAHR